MLRFRFGAFCFVSFSVTHSHIRSGDNNNNSEIFSQLFRDTEDKINNGRLEYLLVN